MGKWQSICQIRQYFPPPHNCAIQYSMSWGSPSAINTLPMPCMHSLPKQRSVFHLQDPHTRLCYDQSIGASSIVAIYYSGMIFPNTSDDTHLIAYFLMLGSEWMLILYN